MIDRAFRFLVGTIGVLIAILAAVFGACWIAAVMALPSTSGTVLLSGLQSPVTISRDRNGIPLISAGSEEDAYFALGYVHAQDRLFQMELMRRRGQGRLAELIGPMGVAPDRFMRTLGVYRRAEDDLSHLDPSAQKAFENYTKGVNAWLGEGHSLPLEFRLLWFKPEPWRSADSLVWQKLMGLELSGNWEEELFDAALAAKLGDKAAALFPSPRADEGVTMQKHAGLYRELEPLRLLVAMTAVVQPTLASNIWVLAGKRTESGKPILANDPHLGFQTPSIWYFAGIDTPKLKVFGATVPGVPLHMLGHNQSLAWGLTTTHSDTSDLFIEQLSDDGKSYVSPEGPKAFTTKTEIINVRFGEPRVITVRETRHGPVVSDILRDDGLAQQHRVLALSSALLQPEDHSGEGVYLMNHAGDAAAFVEALKQFHAPQQNIMFADDKGAIGYYAPGRVPIRTAGDGTVPVPGWSGEYDWIGWIPFAELPHELDPGTGVLINANNKIVRDDYPYLIAAHWNEAYRADRIAQMVDVPAPANVSTTVAAQNDAISLMAREMLPLLTVHVKSTDDLLNKLTRWDGSTARERWEPLVFTVWMERVNARILGDELGDLLPQFGVKPMVLRNVLTQDSQWCDDINTPAHEDCDGRVALAWTDTTEWLTSHKITNPEAIHWGDFHVAGFGHLLFQNLPMVKGLGALSVSTSGDNFTVNRGTFASSRSPSPFRHVHGASLRAVYDLSDLAKSQFALAGGQSGQMGSRHYGDLLTPWRDGRYFTAPTPDTVSERLLLQPFAR